MNQMKLVALASEPVSFEQYTASVNFFEKVVYYGVPAMILFLIAFICYIKVEERRKLENEKEGEDEMKKYEIKNIFSENEDMQKNAIMNWRTHKYDDIHNMKVIGDGFRKSTLLMLQQVLTDNYDKKGDVLIFPIMFSANHVIEVYLKVIVSLQQRLMEIEAPPKLSHDIKQLLEECVANEKVLKDSLGEKGIMEKLNLTLVYITELYSKIERIEVKSNGTVKHLHDMTFSRYANTSERKNPAPHFYVEMIENATIDVKNLEVIYQTVFGDLEDLINHYSCMDDDENASRLIQHEAMIDLMS